MLFTLLAAYLVFKPGEAETYLLLDGFGYYALYLTNWVDPGATNLSITWSLATEEQFYMIWPLFEAFATPLVMAAFWVVAVVVNQLINFGVLDPAILAIFGVEPEHHPEILESTFTPILLGVALAHLLNRAKSFDILQKIAGFFACADYLFRSAFGHFKHSRRRYFRAAAAGYSLVDGIVDCQRHPAALGQSSEIAGLSPDRPSSAR